MEAVVKLGRTRPHISGWIHFHGMARTDHTGSPVSERTAIEAPLVLGKSVRSLREYQVDCYHVSLAVVPLCINLGYRYIVIL